MVYTTINADEVAHKYVNLHQDVMQNKMIRHAHVIDSIEGHINELNQYKIIIAQLKLKEGKLDTSFSKEWQDRLSFHLTELRDMLLTYEYVYGVGDPYQVAIATGVMPNNAIVIEGPAYTYRASVNLEQGNKIDRFPSKQKQSVISPAQCLVCHTIFPIGENDMWWTERKYCSHYCATDKRLAIDHCVYCNPAMFQFSIDNPFDGMI